jgi:transcription initiation factor IIE alpha subunit
MCKACGKEMREYNKLPSTKEFKEKLSRSVGIPTTGLTELIQ